MCLMGQVHNQIFVVQCLTIVAHLCFISSRSMSISRPLIKQEGTVMLTPEVGIFVVLNKTTLIFHHQQKKNISVRNSSSSKLSNVHICSLCKSRNLSLASIQSRVRRIRDSLRISKGRAGIQKLRMNLEFEIA